jgi:hypothetical protein
MRIVLFIFIVSIVLSCSDNKIKQSSSIPIAESFADDSTIQEMRPRFSINATEIISEFKKDERSALIKYSGKVIEVKGIIEKKVQTKEGWILILKGAGEKNVKCEFDLKFSEDAIFAATRENVSVKGYCSGYSEDVILANCNIRK